MQTSSTFRLKLAISAYMRLFGRNSQGYLQPYWLTCWLKFGVQATCLQSWLLYADMPSSRTTSRKSSHSGDKGKDRRRWFRRSCICAGTAEKLLDGRRCWTLYPFLLFHCLRCRWCLRGQRLCENYSSSDLCDAKDTHQRRKIKVLSPLACMIRQTRGPATEGQGLKHHAMYGCYRCWCTVAVQIFQSKGT